MLEMKRLLASPRVRLVKDFKLVTLIPIVLFCLSCLVLMPCGQLVDYATPGGRYAFENKLNVVIPATGAYLSRKTLFERSNIDSAPWRNLSFDVFSLHNRWHQKEVAELLGDGVPAFTIVRDPVDVFISLWNYWSPVRDQYNVTSLHDFVKLIESGNQTQMLSKRWIGQFGRNQMAWDLGVAPEFFDNDQVIDDYIVKLDNEFDLVMIASKMDESLVLLRHLLGWPIERVQHLDRNRKTKTVNPSDLTPDERDALYRWLSADSKIYNYFLRRFNERVDNLNRRLSAFAPFGQSYVDYEANQLRKLNSKLYQRCVLKEGSKELKLSVDYAEYNGAVGYLVNEEHEDCKLYAWNQGAYLKRLKEILIAQVNETSKV